MDTSDVSTGGTMPARQDEAQQELPRFVNPAAREETVPLEHPLEYRGKRYDAITVRRMTTAQVAAFVESYRAESSANPGAKPWYPMFFDAAGEPVPDAVMDAMDEDDSDAVDAVTRRFLPRRFQGAAASS